MIGGSFLLPLFFDQTVLIEGVNKMRRYHHYGVPIKEKMEGEVYHKDISLYVVSYSKNPYGIEFFRFDESYKENPRVKGHPDIISQVPHIAFIVDDLEKEIEGKEVIFGPNIPIDNWKVCFIKENGVLVELIETTLTDEEILKIAEQSE